jgi:3-phenylpropionate/cinnamic acid dioxygenase small subunit
MVQISTLRQSIKYGMVALAAAGITGAAFTWSAPAMAQSSRSLEARVKAIEDEQQIRDLLIEYGHLLDTKDYVAYGNLFARNGTWDGSLGLHKGPADITAMLAHPRNGRAPAPFDPKNVQSFHLMTNFKIQVDGDRATARSKWTFFTKSADKKPTPNLSGHYDDTLIREDGRWKFLSRVAQHDIPE